MIKKMIPIFFSLVLLIITLKIPNFLSYEADMNLFYGENGIHTQRVDYKTNKDFSLLEKIDFVSLNSFNDNQIVALDDSDGMYNVEMTYDKLQLLYKEIKKLYNYQGIVKMEIDDLDRYYNCYLNTFNKNNSLISIYNMTVVLTDENIAINIWFDKDTFEIYQYSMIDGSNTNQFTQYNAKEAMMKYLNINEMIFDKYYLVHQDEINIRLEILKTIQE